jgi:hypothetical protein
LTSKFWNTRVRLDQAHIGSGAQDALKIELVKRKSWSQKIKKHQGVQFSWGGKRMSLRPATFLVQFVRLVVPRPTDPPFGVVVNERPAEK